MEARYPGASMIHFRLNQEKLLRQQTALARYHAAKLKVCSHHDRLIRNYSDRRDDIRVGCGRGRRVWHDPRHVTCMCRSQRNSGPVSIAGISRNRAGCPWNRVTLQIVTAAVEDVHRYVSGAGTAVEDIEVTSRIATPGREVCRGANP